MTQDQCRQVHQPALIRVSWIKKKISPVKKDSSSYLSHFTSACLCLTSIGTTTAAAALTVNNLQYVPDEELFSGGSKLIWTHWTVNPEWAQTVLQADSIDVISRPSGSWGNHRNPVFNNTDTLLIPFPGTELPATRFEPKDQQRRSCFRLYPEKLKWVVFKSWWF